MRGAFARLFSFLIIAVAAAGCQSPQMATGALNPSPFAADLLDPSSAQPASTWMPSGAAENTPPPGFVSFCMRFADQCASPANASPVAADTPATWQLLNRVNTAVNQDISPEDDSVHYGRAEYWTIPTDGYGDCEDYALTKRKALIAAGLPEDALRIAVVRTWDGERHAVLTVTTDKGDYVLDNMRGQILAWSDTNYIWIERQAANNPLKWVSLQSDGITGPAVAALPAPAKPAPVNVPATKPQPALHLHLDLTALLIPPQPTHLAIASAAAPIMLADAR